MYQIKVSQTVLPATFPTWAAARNKATELMRAYYAKNSFPEISVVEAQDSLEVAVQHYLATGQDDSLWAACERSGDFIEDLGLGTDGLVYSLAYYDGPLTLTRVYPRGN